MNCFPWLNCPHEWFRNKYFNSQLLDFWKFLLTEKWRLEISRRPSARSVGGQIQCSRCLKPPLGPNCPKADATEKNFMNMRGNSANTSTWKTRNALETDLIIDLTKHGTRVSWAYSFITKNNQNQKQFLSKYLPVQFPCMISDCFEPAKNKVIPYK